MIKKYITTILFFCVTFVIAQVGIGTTNPDKSAILDIQSEEKGFLIPRMNYNEALNINNAAEGLMVYCTNCCSNGALIFYNSDKWISTITDCTMLIPPFVVTAEDDFDGDGISNTNDIDDDNDGIKDVDEMCGVNTSSFGSSNITSNHEFIYNINNVSNMVIDINEIDNALELYINGVNIMKEETVTVNGQTQIRRSMDVQGQDQTKQAFKADMEFVNPNDALYNSNRIYSPWDARQTADLPRLRIIINEFGKVSLFATATYNQSEPKYNDGLKPVQVRGYTSNGNMGDLVEFNTIPLNPGNNEIKIVSTDESGVEEFIGTFTSTEHCIDLDNDGFSNHLDLDSDGDGCSDAFEGGATVNTTPEFQFNNSNVGINGLKNSLETNIDNGIINYTVINNYNNSTNANVNQCL